MIIWFERLTLPKILFSVSRRIIDKDIKVCFPVTSKWGGVFLRFFSKIFPWLHKRGLILGVQQENGEALCYKAHEVATAVAKLVFEEYFSGREYIPANLLEHSSRVQRAFKAYFISVFKRKIFFLCAAEYACMKDSSLKGMKIQYYLDTIPLQSQFNKAVSRFLEGESRGFLNFVTAIKNNLPVRLLSFIIGFTSRQGHIGKYARLALDKRSKILVEFSRYKFSNDDYIFLFWLPKSDIESERVIMGFDRPDSPYSRENVNLIERKGLRWLNLKKNALAMHFRLWEWLRLLWMAFKDTPFPKLGKFKGVGVWRWKTMLEFAFFLEIWRTIFKKYGIKVIHQHQEHDFWSHIQALAVHLEGGFYFWFHWSVQRIPFSHFNAGYADIFFSWGKLHRDYLDMHDFEYRYMLDIGLIWDYIHDQDAGKRPLLKRNFNSDVNFVIALFDVGSNSWSQFSPYLESYFYRSVIDAILKHPCWAVIIKSKNGLDHLPGYEQIKDLIESLRRQKRCAYLAPADAPFAAFKDADVCVCHGINSVGSIAALCGKKAIHWDLAGDTRHPYYLNGAGKFIFKTNEEVLEALESLAQYSGNQGYIGDHSEWLNFLDPYRDGKGGLRAGKFIRSFLDFTDNGLDGDAALQKATEEFKEQWGSDRVYDFETKNVRLGDNIWLKAEQALKK